MWKRKIKEYEYLNKILANFGDLARSEIVEVVKFKDQEFPIPVVELGSRNLEDPVLAFFGGVHGLEKIGSEVILAFMESLTSLVKWDESFKKRLKHSRLLFMPMVNPVGIWQKTRSNGNGVDLMRNSPLESSGPKALYSGHRLSPHLPWYRGPQGGQMEPEALALCRVVEEKIFPAKVSMAVDVHSGFGARDRFWFPYARAGALFPQLGEVMALTHLFTKTHPHHFYVIEPTSYQYTIDGDLWDFLVDKFQQSRSQTTAKNIFLPWTLEMGSWIWLRKNPLQILNRMGLYHPLMPHRHQRILRRHFTLFDFLHRSILFPKAWTDLSDEDKKKWEYFAKSKWYTNPAA
jgi:hypothetical protein